VVIIIAILGVDVVNVIITDALFCCKPAGRTSQAKDEDKCAVKKPPKQVPSQDMILQKNKEMGVGGGGPFLEIERGRRNSRSTKCDREKLRKGRKKTGSVGYK